MKAHKGAQGHEGAFLGHDTPRGTGALPYIGNAPSDAPISPAKGKVDNPKIIIDSREQRPLVFAHLQAERGTLQSGDYSIAGLEPHFAVERKSIPDLCGSITKGRDRFERELHRLRGFEFARLLIVGRPEEVASHSPNPKAVFSSLSAFEARWKIAVVWEASPDLAALLVERWAWFFWRERTGTKTSPCAIPHAASNGHTEAICNTSNP